ncbi:hypothetical protein [Legionella rowbothamii]|uniref:hypothetical protein n=1 Tax=Legionella rowbothamii TaxID=96229 RepID=UPI001056265B|nr:hypothetical protein [Legionella rowbothamii]
MSDISLVIKRFNALSTTTQVKPIVAALQQVAAKTAGDDLIAKLRRKLLPLTTEDNYSSSKQNLVDLAYDTLLILAELYPLNSVEPITLLDMKDIDPSDRIFVSTGHQFSLSQLIEWHNQRACRTGETDTSKSLLNPLTNNKFSPKDLTHVSALADKKSTVRPAINEMIYSCISSLWENDLFWALVVYPASLIVAYSATMGVVIPIIALGGVDFSLSLLLFNELFSALLISYLGCILAAMAVVIAQDPDPIIDRLGHGVERVTSLITSPFRCSASFFNNNSVEEEELTENFLLSSI